MQKEAGKEKRGGINVTKINGKMRVLNVNISVMTFNANEPHTPIKGQRL